MSAERKEKYWGAEHNAKRRAKYNADPARAEQVKAQRRESYRRSNEVDPSTMQSCLSNVGNVASSGSTRAVQYAGSKFVIGRVFTQTDVAALMGRQPQVIYRWHQRGIFPSPVLTDDTGNRFYADEEVTRFVIIMGEHQNETPHYRTDHDAVRARLFAASFDKNPDRAQAWISERTK